MREFLIMAAVVTGFAIAGALLIVAGYLFVGLIDYVAGDPWHIISDEVSAPMSPDWELQRDLCV